MRQAGLLAGFLCLAGLSQPSPPHSRAPVSLLRSMLAGEVVPCCSNRYEVLRTVNNRACLARPAIIVRPLTTEDVAIAVNFARRNNMEVGRGRAVQLQTMVLSHITTELLVRGVVAS